MKKSQVRQIIKEEVSAAITDRNIDMDEALGFNKSEKVFRKVLEKVKASRPEQAEFKEKEYNDLKAKAEAGDANAKKVITAINSYCDANGDLKYLVDIKNGKVIQTTFASTYGPGGRSQGV